MEKDRHSQLFFFFLKFFDVATDVFLFKFFFVLLFRKILLFFDKSSHFEFHFCELVMELSDYFLLLSKFFFPFVNLGLEFCNHSKLLSLFHDVAFHFSLLAIELLFVLFFHQQFVLENRISMHFSIGDLLL